MNVFFFSFDHPVVVKPGDELRTTCTYSSQGLGKSTFFGKGTHDEMCFAFLKYYPKQKAKVQRCLSFKKLSMCPTFSETVELFDDGLKGCNIPKFTSLTNPATLTMVFQVRGVTSLWNAECIPQRNISTMHLLNEVKDNMCFVGPVDQNIASGRRTNILAQGSNKTYVARDQSLNVPLYPC